MAFRVGRCFCLCLMVLFGITYLWADVTGSFSGYVRDTSGAVIPNASVTATQATTGYARTVATDGSGHYAFLALPPGIYSLTASASGFQQGAIQQITLNVNDALKFDFALKVGNVSETISVNASSLQVETAATATGDTISSHQILAMPLNGRSYLDLLALQPGVAPANSQSGYNTKCPPPAFIARPATSPPTVSLSGPTPSW